MNPELPGFLQSLAPVLDDYGYLAVGGFVFLEDFGVPLPGETILIAAAVYAGVGKLNVVVVGLIALVAAVAGDNVGFAIGTYGGRPLVQRYGRYAFLTEQRLDVAEGFFTRHGGKVVTVARFVEGLRQANGIVAGISEMSWKRFVLFNLLGAALWVGAWTSFGYVAGSRITSLYNGFQRYELYIGVGAAVLIVGFIGYRLLRRRRRRRAAEAER